MTTVNCQAATLTSVVSFLLLVLHSSSMNQNPTFRLHQDDLGEETLQKNPGNEGGERRGWVQAGALYSKHTHNFCSSRKARSQPARLKKELFFSSPL